MTGGLIQLVSFGKQDGYLTFNPQITYFKKIYRRHTIFSIELIENIPDQHGVAVLQASQQPLPISIPNMYGFNEQLGRYAPQSTPTTKSGHAGIGNVPNPDYIPSGSNNLAALFNVMFFNVNYQDLW